MNLETLSSFSDEMEKIAGAQRLIFGSTPGAWGERAFVGAMPGMALGALFGAASAKGKDRKERQKSARNRAIAGALIGAATGAGGGMLLGRAQQGMTAKKLREALIEKALEQQEEVRDFRRRGVERLKTGLSLPRPGTKSLLDLPSFTAVSRKEYLEGGRRGRRAALESLRNIAFPAGFKISG